ncbi:MAG: hypothetical protein HOL85_09560 [Rhodospirillaceae bacterium]|nr:hypothetical protein [Rhodospirillaceae bacterium]MBT6139074.1 hypothetical protein [Rhodospirillaceae bacterium]
MTETATLSPELAEGARNLLINCAGLKSGETVVILHEDPALGWYDLDAPMAVAEEARNLGMHPTCVQVGAPENDRDPGVNEAIAAHDGSVFFSRIGDQDRFGAPMPGKRSVMCYARDAKTLASSYGRAEHQAFLELKAAVNDILLGADRIEITCPLGTSISGAASEDDREPDGDVTIRRFPMGVPQPVSASGFSGQVAIARFLTPTGSKVYEPASQVIDSPVMAEVSSGRLVGLKGEASAVEQVRSHTKTVADLFGIDGDNVHSWHAGIHPGCVYPLDAADNPDRWSNSVFTNPRFLHFHTCGDYPPGEVCWMVLDPTVTVDGVKLWDAGRLCPEAFDRTQACLEKWSELRPLFDAPVQWVGVQA